MSDTATPTISTQAEAPVTRCKMRVNEVTRRMDPNGQVECEIVRLSAVFSNSPENAQWSKWTPSADASIQINNPAAMGKLSRGHEYFVDFTPAPAAAK